MYCEAQVKGHPILLILDREVDEFSIIVEGKTITSRVVVMDAENYAAIMGNDWMKKKNLKKEDEKSDSATDEEMESESDEYEEEYEEKTLVNETYQYLEFKEASFELEFFRTCLKKKEKEINFNIGQLSGEQETQIRTLLKNYNNTFAEELDQLERTSKIWHEIFTEKGPLVKQKFYPMSKLEYKFIGSEIHRMQKAKIIQPSNKGTYKCMVEYLSTLTVPVEFNDAQIQKLKVLAQYFLVREDILYKKNKEDPQNSLRVVRQDQKKILLATNSCKNQRLCKGLQNLPTTGKAKYT
ncbi:35337_t:CDS:2 [Gigaspora margarita]|uniref:35337_t:CDS:1 n=1 Tax=Gigaspora margarita TaxID=4874 RepID=A0ABM8W2I8_GIGMA|nr:35337_t:CDS:2 [Gigaspora margarita]